MHYDAHKCGVPTDLPRWVLTLLGGGRRPLWHVPCFSKCPRDPIWQVIFGWQRGHTGCPQRSSKIIAFGRLRAVFDRRRAYHPWGTPLSHVSGPERSAAGTLARVARGALPQSRLIEFVEHLSCKHMPTGIEYVPRLQSASWGGAGCPSSPLLLILKTHTTRDRVFGACYKLPLAHLCSQLAFR